MKTSSPGRSIVLTPSRRRHRSFKSYDRKGRRTVGSVYARHLPERYQLIDLTEYCRYARRDHGDPIARAIVVSYREALISNPIIFKGQSVRLHFPSWKDLGHETHWYFFLQGIVDQNLPITHAVTINFRDEFIASQYLLGRGPGRSVGELVNRKLEPIYRRAGESLIYAYSIELHRKPDYDWQYQRRQDFASFDATLLLSIPVVLLERVEIALAAWAGVHVARIRRRHSGTPVHIQPVGEHRRFAKGEDNTLRRGVEGIGDYAAKSYPRIHDLREFYGKHQAPFAEALQKVNHASADVISKAKAAYELLREFAMSKWEDVAMDLATGKSTSRAAGGVLEIGQVLRIFQSDPVLADKVERFWSAAAVERHLAG